MKHFIHIPKTGGMSLWHALRGRVVTFSDPLTHKSLEYSASLSAHMKKNQEHHGYQHARWRDLHPRYQGSCFALVRNPWARVVSRYWFGRQDVESGKVPPEYVADTFVGFLEEREHWGNEPFYWHRAVRGWYPALDHVTDETGVIRCDILRTEHLDDDVEAYTGVRPPKRRNVTLPAHDYREMYDDSTRQIVADWYASDVEAFGFEFEGAATRNVWGGVRT